MFVQEEKCLYQLVQVKKICKVQVKKCLYKLVKIESVFYKFTSVYKYNVNVNDNVNVKSKGLFFDVFTGTRAEKYL